MAEQYTASPSAGTVLAQLQVHLGWVTGLFILITAVLALRYERRQARQLAERSKELEHLSTELLRVNKMKSEFLANVSHELRTPLNAIVGFADLLRDGVYGELTPRQAGPIRRIEVSANHLRHLVDQILDLAKMAAGRLEIHSETIDLRPFILDVASEVEPLLGEKKLHLSLAIGASLPRVTTDPTHLRQILMNLIGNAVKYTDNGGIIIRAHVNSADDPMVPPYLRTSSDAPANRPHPWVVLQVVDSGIGIAQTHHTRVFEEFEQVNAGPRGDSMTRGTGLGLPISRRLAHLLGGELTLESTLGKGSTFTIWLPAKAT
ncbi:MAG TPA: HAMP domain-containing sensor histidine kinase [Gemmatimonadaceae bacterium]|jgi:signal transduction histidine kinase|nr:HAMP domain-containing sensor histidine kinase [Gemmatimonadaceae bacterium]